MAEWLKFTFATQDTYRSRIVQKVNGVVASNDGEVDENWYLGNGHDDASMDRPTLDHYVQVTDDMDGSAGTHTVQFDLLAADGTVPTVTLESIHIEGVDYTLADMILAPQLKIYNHIDAEYQTILDNGLLNEGSVVTQDLGYGSVSYNQCSWEDNMGLLCGTGSWVFTFDTPLEPWMRTTTS